MKLTKSQLKQIIKEEVMLHISEKKKGKYDDGDDKDEKCDYVPCDEEIQNEAMGPQSNVNVAENGSVVLGFAGSDCRHVLQKSDAIDLAEQLMIALGAPVELVEQLMSALKLNEAYSEKQRKWACAQTGDSRKNFKGKPSLTKKEADEMCKDVELKGKKK